MSDYQKPSYFPTDKMFGPKSYCHVFRRSAVIMSTDCGDAPRVSFQLLALRRKFSELEFKEGATIRIVLMCYKKLQDLDTRMMERF